jgi:hypothetical protein
MTIEYLNRRGQKYYLHQGQTKTGKPKYFFSMKLDGVLIDTIPQGYEIYENPNAQVFLRKIPPQWITPEEIAIVRQGVKQYAQLEYFLVDVKDRNIIVYLSDQNVDELSEMLSFTYSTNSTYAKTVLIRSLTYSPMMQFVLQGYEPRHFVVQRWCFRGSVEGWMTLAHSDSLSALVKEYGCHLGKESFYDLM